MAPFDPAPQPKSLLGRHRLLSPTAGIRVSPLCIGAMNFGEAWYLTPFTPLPLSSPPCQTLTPSPRGQMLGAVPKKEVFALLDYFYSQGGNFIDTANNYQDEQSELWIGEWLASKTKDPKEPNFRDQVRLLLSSLAS